MAHARLGPSNHRWPHCPGSIREEAQYPDISGDAAIDGTGSHLLLETCLLEGQTRADAYLGKIIGVGDPDKSDGWIISLDRCDRVQMCLDYIERRKVELSAQFPDGTIKVEAETQANPGGYFGRDDWWGTCDVTIYVLNPTGGLHFIEIVDYKDGRGWVKEKDNSQLLAYCGGQMRPYVGSGPDLVRPFRTERVAACRMTIVQPKTTPVVRYQDASAEYVMDKLSELNQAAYLTDKEDAPLVSGKHCQWCKANPKRGGHCNASTEQSLGVMKQMSTELTLPEGTSLFEYIGNMVADVKTLSNDQLSQLADAKDGLLAAFEKVEAEIQGRIETGQSVSGYAMVNGRKTQVWNASEEEIVKALKNRRMKQADIFPPKMISPAQMQKSDSLTDRQKQQLTELLVSEKFGPMKLKKVERQAENAVEQTFANIPVQQQPELNTTTMSFL